MAENNTESRMTPATAALNYGKIAKTLQGLGELSLAYEVAEKGSKRFPNNSNLHIVRGEILVARYNSENRPEFLKAALMCFERALRIDPQSYLAKLLASQIYLKAGARKQAKALLEDILKTAPDDEKAGALMKVIRDKEKALEPKPKPKPVEAPPAPAAPAPVTQVKPAAAPPPVAKETIVKPAPAKQPEVIKPATLPTPVEAEYEEPGELVVAEALSGSAPSSLAAPHIDEKMETTQWVLDEKVVIGTESQAEDELIQENLIGKLTIFSRLEGLKAIFLLDGNGLPIKILNKARVDENIIPSMVFNLYKASINGIRRTGLGSFQRGSLVTPLGTFIIANVFYATLAVVVDNDANLTAVDARVQRYLGEVVQ